MLPVAVTVAGTVTVGGIGVIGLVKAARINKSAAVEVEQIKQAGEDRRQRRQHAHERTMEQLRRTDPN
jgi:hypothetical protein